MTPPRTDIRVLAFIGHHDRDLLPSFLAHYRQLGVGGFLLALHGLWPERVLDWLTAEDDVAIWDLLSGRYEDIFRRSVLNQMAEGFRGQWVILADADEFLELPCSSLGRTVRTLEVLGLDCLPAFLLQRLSRDGGLPAIDPGQSWQEQFPLCDFGLCEAMGVERPVWKSKYPLARVGAAFHIDRGNHWPPNPMSLAHAPIRGVVHHLKWRAALLEAFELERGPSSNTDEMTSFKRWLDEHDGKLPMVNARPVDRRMLVRQGLLVKPDRRHLLIGAATNRQRHSAGLSEARRARLGRKLNRLLGAGDRKAAALPGRAGPKSKKICLATFDLSPPLTSGGIGTAMQALAEQLIVAGHAVEILFCPYEGPPELWPLWHDYWENRGARLHYLPRTEGDEQRYLSQGDFLDRLTRFLEERHYDVVHVADAAGYGADVAILKAAGLGFSGTKLLVTAHGGVAWHRRGNRLDWTEDEAAASFAEKQMLRLADLIFCPSRYMQDRLLKTKQARPEQLVVLPNALSSQTRSFGVASRSPRPVDELVMMGRIEHRKGIDRFAGAVRRVAARGRGGFRITFLGRPGPGIEIEEIRAMLGPPGETARFISNFDHIKAVNYVKTHDCLVVIPSLRENLPYSLYECLENHVPVLASDAGGMAELVADEDRERLLVAGDEERLAEALEDALTNGIRPGRLAFEPSLVGLQLARWHGKLVEEAEGRISEEDADDALPDVLMYGGVEHGGDWAMPANRAVADRSQKYLLWHHADVRPDGHALVAMTNLMLRSEADAVVVGCRIDSGMPKKPWEKPVDAPTLSAPGGPPMFGISRNIYGAGPFLIRRDRFLELGGFDAALSSSRVAHWDLLNRLAAAGGEVIGIPKTLASAGVAMADELGGPIDPVFAERLARPWPEPSLAMTEGFLEPTGVLNARESGGDGQNPSEGSKG